MGDSTFDDYVDAIKGAARKIPPYTPMSTAYRHVDPEDTDTLEKLGLRVISFDEFINNK